MWKRIAVGVGILAALLSELALPLGPSAPTVLAQSSPSLPRAEALVIINSTSASFADFQHSIRPYLDHVHAPAGAPPGTPNVVYRYDSSGFPTVGTYYNYWVDPIFSTTTGPLAVQVQQLAVRRELQPPVLIMMALALLGLGSMLIW